MTQESIGERMRVSGAGRLEGKVAIVTGSSSGIGRAIAERLARDGATVIVTYRESADSAHEVTEGMEANGGRGVAIRADISKISDVRRLFEETLGRFGQLDIFVTSAGVPHRKPMIEVTEEEFDRVFDVNTKGVFFALQEAARRISDGGRIINVSSSQTAHPPENFAVYAGSKAAPQLFVGVLAQELGARGVTVNSVVAGPTDSGALRDAPSDYKDAMGNASPLGRLARPEDIADATAFLASDDSRWVTGQHLVVDGGATHF